MKGEVYIEIRDKNGNLKQKIKEENKVFDNTTREIERFVKNLKNSTSFQSNYMYNYGISIENFQAIGLFNETQDENSSIITKLPEYFGDNSTSAATNKNGQQTKFVQDRGTFTKGWLFNVTENTTIKSIALSSNSYYTIKPYSNMEYYIKLNDGRYYKNYRIYDNMLSGYSGTASFNYSFTEYLDLSTIIPHNPYLAKDKTKMFYINDNNLNVLSMSTYKTIQSIPIATKYMYNVPFILKQGNFLYAYAGEQLDTTNRQISFYKFDPTATTITLTPVKLTYTQEMYSSLNYIVTSYSLSSNYSYSPKDNIIFCGFGDIVVGNFIFDFEKLLVIDGKYGKRIGQSTNESYHTTVSNFYDFLFDTTTLLSFYPYQLLLSTLLNLKTPIDLIAGDVLNIEYTITIV